MCSSRGDPVLVPATLEITVCRGDLALAPDGALVFVPEALTAILDGVAFDEDPAVQAALEDLGVDIDPAVAPT